MGDRKSVLDQAHHRRVSYPKGRLIYDEGESATALFRVERGCVRLQVNGRNGRRQIVAFLFPGDCFGVSVDAHTSAAEAVGEVDLTRYPLDSVLELSARSTDMVLELIRTASRSFRDLAHHVQHVNHLPVPERVLWFLQRLARRLGAGDGQSVPLPMSRRDIGDFLSVAPETLSRTIHDLQTQGVLVLDGRRAFTLNRSFRPRRPDPLVEPVAGGDSAAVWTAINDPAP